MQRTAPSKPFLALPVSTLKHGDNRNTLFAKKGVKDIEEGMPPMPASPTDSSGTSSASSTPTPKKAPWLKQ